jgi:hypothetical protein
MTDSAFDPRLAFETFAKHDVKYVLIGGLAARLHGSPSITFDLDVCYERSPENLVALASALKELHATLRGVKETVPFRLDAKSLAQGDSFAFMTDAGPLDVLGTPPGTTGYAELELAANEALLFSHSVKVVSLAHLIRMKRAAGRPKDLIEVEILEALKDELENPPRIIRREG